MSIGKDYTDEEKAQLAEIDKVFERLYPENSTKTEFGASVAVLRTYFVRSARHATAPASKWCAFLQEIHGEIVVRLGQNIRKTTKVQNRLLMWRTAFLACESTTSCTSTGSDGVRTLGLAWMNGLVEYFKDRLEKCFVELNICKTEVDCLMANTQASSTAQPSVPGLHTPLSIDSEQLVTRCIASARTVVNPQMSASPYFVCAVSTCREMVQVLQLVQGLLYHFSAHFMHRWTNSSAGNGGIHRTNTVELNFSDDYLAPLRTPQWLFRFIFLFLGAMDLLQDPHRDTTALSGNQLDFAIHCIACIVGEVDGKHRDSDVKSTLDALVLGHVKNSCLSEFPPQQTLDLLDRLRSNLSGTTEADTGKSVDPVARCGPLLQLVLVRYPNFMTAITNFARRNGVEEWGVSVMLAQLFCWDIETPPAVTTNTVQVSKVRYRLPEAVGSTRYTEDALAATAVYGIAREVLQLLLSALLSATSPAANGPDATNPPRSSAGSAANEVAAGSSDAQPLSAAEQKLCALLLGVVSWLNTVDFPNSARMARWSALDVGPQVMREFNMGKWCLARVLREVLLEVTGTALQQLEAQADETPDTVAQDDSLVALATPLLQYLLRVERVWNALTNHAIELDSTAFEDMRNMGVKAMPKAISTVGFANADVSSASRALYDTLLFADYKYQFYEAVQLAMKTRWPKAYADLLTEPLLDSIHVYLVHAESATQRGVGQRPNGAGSAAAGVRSPGPASSGGGGRPAGAKRSPLLTPQGGAARRPPKPESVVLTSKKDLNGALRLVRCIVNRDHFIHRYTASVRERLLARPPPDAILDADLEKNKKRCEQEVEQFLATWLGDAALLKTVRELHAHYAPQTTTFNAAASVTGGSGEACSERDFKLTSTILDWRLWGDNEVAAADDASLAALPNTAAELRGMAAQAAETATWDSAPLPFPNDVLPYLENVEQRYNNDHNGRMLRWDWRNHVFTTFTLMYPKENGRLTTVNGTLLLQRLFLAIAAYGRAGIELETLAKRAGLPEARVLGILNPCLNRDHLLVRVGERTQGDAPTLATSSSPTTAASPAMRLALNYDYIRPSNRPRGDYIYWPDMTRRRFVHRGADQAATLQKRRDIIKTSIMQVMKQVQHIHHDDLFAMVREKNSKRFEVMTRIFKQVIEDLIGKDFMARAEDNQNEYVFRA